MLRGLGHVLLGDRLCGAKAIHVSHMRLKGYDMQF